MGKLFKLMPYIHNENMKIYRRPRSWIMFSIVVAILLLTVVLSKAYEPKVADNENYKQLLEQRIAAAESQLQESGLKEGDPGWVLASNNLLADKYALEHEIDVTKSNLWGLVLSSAGLLDILGIFTIVIAADIVAGEFSGGTIKLLLIRPVKRWKILLSKYLATLLYALLGAAILMVSALIIGGFAYGFDGLGIPHLFVKDGMVHERSMLVQAFINYGYESVSLLMMVTLAFMISSAFRSSSMAIGSSIGLMFLGNVVVGLLHKYSWVKYFLFANMNLRQYSPGNTPVVEGMTMGFSIAILILYFIAFNAIAWSIFTKRDVAA